MCYYFTFHVLKTSVCEEYLRFYKKDSALLFVWRSLKTVTLRKRCCNYLTHKLTATSWVSLTTVTLSLANCFILWLLAMRATYLQRAAFRGYITVLSSFRIFPVISPNYYPSYCSRAGLVGGLRGLLYEGFIIYTSHILATNVAVRLVNCTKYAVYKINLEMKNMLDSDFDEFILLVQEFEVQIAWHV